MYACEYMYDHMYEHMREHMCDHMYESGYHHVSQAAVEFKVISCLSLWVLGLQVSDSTSSISRETLFGEK